MAGEATSLVLYPSELPYIPEAYTYAGDYLITAAAQRNRNHMQSFVELGDTPFALQELMLDPQTSGGLFLSAPKSCAHELLSAIQEVEPQAKIVGEVLLPQNLPILLR